MNRAKKKTSNKAQRCVRINNVYVQLHPTASNYLNSSLKSTLVKKKKKKKNGQANCPEEFFSSDIFPSSFSCESTLAT